MPYAGVNGQRLYYEVGGDGDAVVLLHGSRANADIMEAPATGLASGFRALRIDRRGAARSTPVDAPVSLLDEVADLAALLDWLSIESTSFLTHDDGAELALEFAWRHPTRVQSIGFLAPVLDSYPFGPETNALKSAIEASVKVDPKIALQQMVASHLFDGTRDREGLTDRIEGILARSIGTTASVQGKAPRPSPSHAEKLEDLAFRFAVLWGDRDLPDYQACAQALSRILPGATAYTFPGLGHFLHIEDSRAVMRKLTDFFLPEPAIER